MWADTGGNLVSNPPETNTDSRQSNASTGLVKITLIAIPWLFAAMTILLGADYYSQIHGMPYHIPQFLADLFVQMCQLALGSVALGATVTTYKVLSKPETPKLTDSEKTTLLLTNEDHHE